jgi:hypothetical protein
MMLRSSSGSSVSMFVITEGCFLWTEDGPGFKLSFFHVDVLEAGVLGPLARRFEYKRNEAMLLK